MHQDTDTGSAEIDMRRRRARFRSWHRGMREADLILGRFADARTPTLSAVELDEYEALLEIPDGELLQWLTGEQPAPANIDTPLFRAIRALATQA